MFAVVVFFPVDRPNEVGRPLQVGFVGRIAHAKGIDTLLRAVALLATATKGNRDIAIHIYGDGEPAYVAQLRQLQHDLAIPEGVVQWHGAVAHRNVPDAIRSLDVLVVPTAPYKGYKEQFGRVVIEALACRIPLITSDNGELPVLIRQTGGGLVFPAENAQELARCIKTAITSRDTFVSMAQRGYDYVLTHYTYNVLTDMLEVVMKTVQSRYGPVTAGVQRMAAPYISPES